MTLTTREVALLRSKAQTLKPMFQIGKEGLTADVERQIEKYLARHELGKITVLENAPLKPNDVCDLLAREQIITIQVIGRNVVLYRPNPLLKKQDRAL